MKSIFVLGCGFGTALSILWSKAGHSVTAYSKFPDEIEAIKRDRTTRLLPGITIPTGIEFTCDITRAETADIIVFAVPSKFVAEVAEQIAPYVTSKAVLVSASKGFAKCTPCMKKHSGISADIAYCRLSEIVSHHIPKNPVVALTGPCHAEEVAKDCPTTVVAATSGDMNYAEYVQGLLQTKTFRVYANDDICGSELGGALKNPIALCCGIAKGMGSGDNSAAALMTRGMAEIKRLGVELGASWQTFTGLSGIGDLIVTCTSIHSRNYRAGLLIGKGVPAEEAIKQIGTVEGYECVKVAVELAEKLGVDIPIFNELYKICYEGLSPAAALDSLMNRPLRNEREWYQR